MERFDPQRMRSFQPSDLAPVLAAAGKWTRATGFCGYLHPGDVAHCMSNALRGENLQRHIALYLGDAGELVGLVVIWPARTQGFDVMLAPEHCGGDMERGLLAWAEQATRDILPSEAIWAGSDVMGCDTRRAEALRTLGYVPQEEPYTWVTTRPLAGELPQPRPPAGFAIRSAAGEAEAEALGAVHATAFGSSWPGDAYRAVMRTPGYDAERELVVVAPDGRLAAFLVYWPDPLSRCGLFEPVGCASEFRRRGLTQAPLYAGMHRMRERDMTTAMVKHLNPERNLAAANLYQSVGFTLFDHFTDYRKSLM